MIEIVVTSKNNQVGIIVKEAQGGKIWVQSRLGEGSEFGFYFDSEV